MPDNRRIGTDGATAPHVTQPQPCASLLPCRQWPCKRSVPRLTWLWRDNKSSRRRPAAQPPCHSDRPGTAPALTAEALRACTQGRSEGRYGHRRRRSPPADLSEKGTVIDAHVACIDTSHSTQLVTAQRVAAGVPCLLWRWEHGGSAGVATPTRWHKWWMASTAAPRLYRVTSGHGVPCRRAHGRALDCEHAHAWHAQSFAAAP